MAVDFVSLFVISLIAAATPLVARLIPGRPIPETVFLLIAGAVLGPYALGFIAIDESISFLSDLGLAFLFLMAGYEINTKNLTGSQGKRGLLTWCVSLLLAFVAVRLSPNFSVSHLDGIAVALAMTTTALGALIPILKERNVTGTPVGNSVLSYGTWGELCPIVVMALLLSARQTWQTLAVLAVFLLVAVLTAVFSSKVRKAGLKALAFLSEGADTTSQSAVRITVLLLVALVALSAIFDLDIVLGSFAAGFVLRYIIPEGDPKLETKLDAIAYGFFVPVFFVASGANINLMAVTENPVLLVAFIVMLVVIRAVPVFVSLSTHKETRTMTANTRISVSLYCTTALPLIVAITSVAVNAGAMDSSTASVLVSAGAITVFLMPLLALIAHRVNDAQPIEAIKEIKEHPHEVRTILHDHIALEKLLAQHGHHASDTDPLRTKAPDSEQPRELSHEAVKKVLDKTIKTDAVDHDKIAEAFIQERNRRIADWKNSHQSSADETHSDSDNKTNAT